MINQWIAYGLIVIGLVFDLVAILGLIRLPDLYSRLQTAVKCVTLGTAAILLGAAVYFGFNPSGYKALLAMGFVLLTAPVSAHAIARAAHRQGIALAKEPVTDEYSKDYPVKEE